MGVDTNWLLVLKDTDATHALWEREGHLGPLGVDGYNGREFDLTYAQLGLPSLERQDDEHSFLYWSTDDPRLVIIGSTVRAYGWLDESTSDDWTIEYNTRVRRWFEPFCERIVLATENDEPASIAELDVIEARLKTRQPVGVPPLTHPPAGASSCAAHDAAS